MGHFHYLKIINFNFLYCINADQNVAYSLYRTLNVKIELRLLLFTNCP